MKLLETKGEIGKYFVMLSLVFTLGIVIGIDLTVRFPDESVEIVEEAVHALAPIYDANRTQFAVGLFVHNASIAAVTFLLGIFFGVVPFLVVFVNGLIIGLIGALIAAQVGLGVFLWGVLPHGVIEMPAIILAAALGTWLGGKFWRRLRYKEAFSPHFTIAVIDLVRVVLPLLIMAAIIEAFVTQAILQELIVSQDILSIDEVETL